MNVQSTELLARLSQELTDAKVSLNKQVEETTQRMAVKTAEVHDLNEAIRALKEQNANVRHSPFLRIIIAKESASTYMHPDMT